LFEEGAVVRSYGRKDGQRRTLTPLPYSSLTEAWPLIRAILRRRLRHGYKIIEPEDTTVLYFALVNSELCTMGKSSLLTQPQDSMRHGCVQPFTC
jgi:hypothetical protein